MLRYALIGRVGTGTNTIKHLLLQADDIKLARSYTDRPPKPENDEAHIFIDDIANVKAQTNSEPVLMTTHNNHSYCYTREELENADVIPIDPQNFQALCSLFPNDIFRILYINATLEQRLANVVANADNILKAEETFIKQSNDEEDAFVEFEKPFFDGSLSISNMFDGRVIYNDFTDSSDIHDLPGGIRYAKRIFVRMKQILKDLVANDRLDENEQHEIRIAKKATSSNDSSPYSIADAYLPIDHATELVLIDKDGMNIITKSWLSLETLSIE